MDQLIQIEGRSGCPIKVYSNDGKLLVRKTSGTVDYNNRLVKQQEKQEAFRVSNKLNYFTAPAITANGEHDNLSWFEMPYIQAEKYSSFLAKQPKSKLTQIIQALVDYFTNQIATATNYNEDELNELLERKTQELIPKINKASWLTEEIRTNLVNQLKGERPKVSLPKSTCHGDFTLSNMLFANQNKIYLIDFLDSFVDSPVIDFVKLRQDTKFLWSLNLEKQEHGETDTRLRQTLAYIDSEVSAFLNRSFPDVTSWEDYFTLMNFARIVPYAQSSDYQYLNTVFKELLNK